jgi:hypothetical protein
MFTHVFSHKHRTDLAQSLIVAQDMPERPIPASALFARPKSFCKSESDFVPFKNRTSQWAFWYQVSLANKKKIKDTAMNRTPLNACRHN